jgi:anti-sigma B factor antagonist
MSYLPSTIEVRVDPVLPFKVIETGPGAVSLVGELDISGLPNVRASLANWAGDITIDCSGLTFIDSSGLGMFVEFHKTREALGVKLVLIDPAPCVTRVLELTGLDAVFNVMICKD